MNYEKITWDNWEECIDLEVADEQADYIASNKYSLAESYVALLNDDKPPMSFAIYDDETMVGFMMLQYDTVEENGYEVDDAPYYDICRFMIDKKYQNKGLGKQSLVKLLEYIKTFPQGEATAIYVGYNIKNSIVRKLFQSFGFIETGKQYVFGEDIEVIARLAL